MSSSIEECIPELRKSYKKLPWLHSHPFSWPHSSPDRPVKTKSKFGKTHWQMNAYLAIGYLGFVVYRTVEACNDRNQRLEQQLYLVLMSVLYAFGTFYSSSTLFKCEGFIQFQRSHIKFVREGQRHVLHHELQLSRAGGLMVKIFKLLVCSIYYSVCSLAFGIFALNMVNSSSPEFPSSLLLPYASGPLYTFILVLSSSLYQGYLLLSFAPALTIWSGHVFFFAFFMVETLQVQMSNRIRPCTSGHRTSTWETTWLKSTFRHYKSLRVHTNGFNEVTATFNGMLHANIVTLIVMFAYAAVRSEGIVAFFSAYLGVVAFVAYFLLSTCYGMINQRSRALLQAVRVVASAKRMALTGHGKAVQCEIRSMNDLRIKAGSTFYYDKALVLTIVEIILSQSVNMLLLG